MYALKSTLSCCASAGACARNEMSGLQPYDHPTTMSPPFSASPSFACCARGMPSRATKSERAV